MLGQGSQRPASETTRYALLSSDDPGGESHEETEAQPRQSVYDDWECPSSFVPSPCAACARRSQLGGLLVLLGLICCAAWALNSPQLDLVHTAKMAAQRASSLVLVTPRRPSGTREEVASAPARPSHPPASPPPPDLGPQREDVRGAAGGGMGAGASAGSAGAAPALAAPASPTSSTTTTAQATTPSTRPRRTTSTRTSSAITTTTPTSSTRTSATTTVTLVSSTTAAPSTTTTEASTPTTSATASAPEHVRARARSSAQGPLCHDAQKGEPCYNYVAWAMKDGLRRRPELYPGLDANSSFADFQESVHRSNGDYCPKPCRHSGELARGAACRDARAPEQCYEDTAWAMRGGIWEHPEWYERVVPESRFEEFQAELHRQNASLCPKPCKDLAVARHYRGVPGASLDLPALNTPWADRRELSFYVYRAQSEADFPPENVDVGDLAGVMWYLHNEIVPSAGHHRKFNITRLLRFKLTVKTTWAFYNVHRRQFGGFAAFDSGLCTVPDCDRVWKHFGFIVGCQFVNVGLAGYVSSGMTRVDGNCKEPFCNSPVWYSLPGPCPSERLGAKTSSCMEQMPGGLCEKATGERNCTYSVEEAGAISLDELVGIEDYPAFFEAGNREYVLTIDGGVGNSFWNGKRDLRKCRNRIAQVKTLFRQKYPHLPACDDLPPPPCDFDGYFKDELSWPAYDEPIPRGDS